MSNPKSHFKSVNENFTDESLILREKKNAYKFTSKCMNYIRK